MKNPIQLCRGIRAYSNRARSVALAATILLMLGVGRPRAHEHQHTHASLSIGALLFLDQAAPEDGALFSAIARQSIRNGSINEDDYWNFLHHFYDPKTRLNTHSGVQRITAPERASGIWTEAMTDFRNENALSAFERLGRVCHLLQDMTSPAHVHNDAHAEIGFGDCKDGDDFENWGWTECTSHTFTNILEYVSSTNVSATLGSRMVNGLSSIFYNQPQRFSHTIGPNIAHSFVHGLADAVYNFTTFEVSLRDTYNGNDRGAGELKAMFPSLEEARASGAWWIGEIGFSEGLCVYTDNGDVVVNESWWIMPGCYQGYENFATVYVVNGNAYIENTGGVSGSGPLGRQIPETLIPAQYDRPWFIRRYGSKDNSAGHNMLRIYGDVLYPAAVAYGAGLLQAFLDEAIMPKPIPQSATVPDGRNARLNGQANAGGKPAVAWFEWGNSTGFGNATAPQAIGAGANFLSIGHFISGLLPETTYHYRLASSNEYGIRYSTNRTFRTLNFALAGGGLNAWQITDNLTDSGSTLLYVTKLTGPQHQAAINSGWRLLVNSRFTTDFGGKETMDFGYGTGSGRFLVWLDLDANGNLIANLDSVAIVALTTNGIGATLYHTHEIRYTNANATYYFDGVPKRTWPGTGSDLPAGEVFWGAGASGGMGEMNFHQVRFESPGVVASYEAGSGGNPSEVPDPVNQGWTRRDGARRLGAYSVAPDGEPFVPLVETFGASGLGLQGAQLNGRIDPRGAAALAWFEWGTDANYGNVTADQAFSAAQGWADASAQLGALTQDTTYHYRLVATNSFGIRFGTNRTFTTPSYFLTGAIPNAWQITDNDNSTTSGRTLRYTNSFPVSLQNGWRLTATTRLITDFADTMTMTVSYVQGTKRFLFWLDFDSDGDLTVMLDGKSAVKLTTNKVGATNYHTHQVNYTNGVASYWFDGRLVDGNWVGIDTTSGYTAGQISWGATSSPGRGQMNFHRVEFAIGDSNVVAAYDAGTAGDPSTAPNPTTQGWLLTAGAGPTTTPLSPDPVGFQPIADAETLPATAVGPNAAQLNASVNPRGEPTAIWFEWGITPDYGNRIAVPNFGGSETRLVAQALSGLTANTTYHYRVVASNEFAVSFGSPQTFRTRWFQDSGIQLAAVDVGSVAWGDYDNDGDLDLIITGQADTNQVTALYRNLGGTNLAAVNSALPPVNQSAVAWGDYNNDGYLDLAISGWQPSGAISRIYRNAQDGTFLDANAGLPGLQWSSVTWSDYDNDGDLDLLLTGLDGATTNGVTSLYRNDGGTNFVDINAGLPGVAQGNVAWSDFDGDGDQDFVLTGRDNSQIQLSRLYRNSGGGIFSDTGVELPGVDASSVVWGDYDGDADPDLLLTGWNGGVYVAHLFRNERSENQSTFVDIEANLPGLSASSVAWGDYDNDGDLDILAAGWSGDYSARIFRNDGEGVFVDIGAELTGVNWASATWVDIDNNGALDALVTGSTASTRVCYLYRNGVTVPNVPPTAPTGLAGSGVGNSATVNWQPATDNQTPLSALTYNLVLSSVTNGIDLASPMANVTNGYRRVVQVGSAGHNHSWTFAGLNPGTYYFSVQAIDSVYAGGAFAPWQSFEVAVPPVVIARAEILQPGRVRIHFAGSAGTAYEVWGSSDLEIWTRLGPSTALLPGEFEYIDATAPPSRRFYQVRASQ